MNVVITVSDQIWAQFAVWEECVGFLYGDKRYAPFVYRLYLDHPLTHSIVYKGVCGGDFRDLGVGLYAYMSFYGRL